MFWCSNCLNVSTRPRITFNKKGFCNACQWAEEKKFINWTKRQQLFKKILPKKKTINMIVLFLLAVEKMVLMLLIQ